MVAVWQIKQFAAGGRRWAPGFGWGPGQPAEGRRAPGGFGAEPGPGRGFGWAYDMSENNK